ncbi:MAG: trigger factor, partial [Christensenellales bacterium]
MATTYEKLSSNKVRLGFVVDAKTFDAGIVKAYKKNAKNISIPGFRRGHVPMQVIENHYGAGVFYEDAFEILFPELYDAAIKEHDVNPVDRPELNMDQIGKGQELKFSVDVFVRPDVELGAYTKIGVEMKVDEVTDDDVMAEIERARDRASRFVEVTERAVKLDDQVNIDYAGFVGEEQFEGGTAQGHDLVIGSGSFIPGFEDQLVGAQVGQELDVTVTFPEEYHAEALKGKEAIFKVKVNSIREKEVPALDDEFVKEASETADTVADYKAEIRNTLESQAKTRAENAFENEVIEKVVENATVEIPDAMIEDQIDSMIREMEMQLMYQGMRLDDYLKYTGQTRENMRGMYRQEAERRVRTQLVIDQVRKAESVEADEAEIDEEMKTFAENNRKSLEEFKETLSEG